MKMEIMLELVLGWLQWALESSLRVDAHIYVALTIISKSLEKGK